MRAEPSPVLASVAFVLSTATGAGASPAGQRLQEALIRGDAALGALTVQWEQGRPEGDRRRLLIELSGSARTGAPGQARLADCPAGATACREVGAGAALTAGQRERLLSGLRAAGLGELRSAGPGDSAPDRALTVTLPGGPPAQFRLARADWPAGSSGSGGGDSEGVAAFLDELAGALGRAAVARRPLPVPRTVDELSGLRLKLTLRPREKPGGTVLIERGVAQVTPEEGTRRAGPGDRAAPAPVARPFRRPLSKEEQQRLVAALGAAALDQLEDAVPRRAAPAVGDTDGRLLTLHLLPLLDDDKAAPAASKGAAQGKTVTAAAQAAPAAPAYQPRGWERFLADLQRSPAAPLVEQLLAILLTPPEAALAGQPKEKEPARAPTRP